MRPRNEVRAEDAPKFWARYFRGCGGGRKTAGASKYRAVATWIGESRFDSKKEAGVYVKLLALFRSGALRFPPLRQVPFQLPGGITYRVDFLIQELDGRVRFLDAKGFRTKEFKLKKKQVEDLYPGVKIEEV